VSLGRPEFLWLLLLIPLLGLHALRGRLLREKSWAALAQRGRLPGNRSTSMIAALAFLFLALAQPRFGRLASPALPPGQDVVLLVDVSKSMGVEDAVPSRLAVAVDAAASLVEALAADPASRAGVAAFAGRGVLRCPLTENLRAATDALKRLKPGTVRPGGTDLGAGLDAALDAFGEDEHAEGRAIVIFSDGEDHAGRWRSRLARLAKDGVVVHAVAIGDAEQGHPVPAGTANEPLKYEGEPVLSRRVDSALEAVAGQTDGAMLRLGLARADLGTLYRGRIAPAAKRKRELARIPDRPERFPLFLASALGLALAGCWPAGRFGAWRRAWSSVALALLLAALALSLLGAGQGPGSPASELVAKGQAAYDKAQFREALAAFEAAIERAPDRAVPRYDAAAALFQLEDYAGALRRYREARDRADTGLRTKIDFALGNTALAIGDVAGAVEHYDRCLGSTATGPGLDDVRRDAAINRAFAIEQARSALSSEGESDPDQPTRKSRNRPPGARKRGGGDEQGPDEPPDANQSPEGGAGGDGRQDRPPDGRRRTGGAGGAGKNAAAPGASADDRLDAALDAIRDAERRRLPEETPSEPAGDNRKDW
jgi:Ca-activated chloride channel family protein